MKRKERERKKQLKERRSARQRTTPLWQKLVLPAAVTVGIGVYIGLTHDDSDTPQPPQDDPAIVLPSVDVNKYASDIVSTEFENTEGTLHLVLQTHEIPDQLRVLYRQYEKIEKVPEIQKNIFRILQDIYRQGVRLYTNEGIAVADNPDVKATPLERATLNSIASSDQSLEAFMGELDHPSQAIFFLTHPEAMYRGYEDPDLSRETTQAYVELAKAIGNRGRRQEFGRYVARVDSLRDERSRVCVQNSIALARELHEDGLLERPDAAALIGGNHFVFISHMFQSPESRAKYGLEGIQLKVYVPHGMD
ncbi:MAG: hypothetical protein ABH879_06915 [archaeon]